MMRDALEAEARRVQARVQVSAGDRFVRGGRLVTVTALEDGFVIFRDVAAAEERVLQLSDFKSRALRKVELVLGPSDDPVEIAWGIARQVNLTTTDRAHLLSTLLSGDREADAAINGWISDLLAGRELKRGT
jgi:hypothetical protein